MPPDGGHLRPRSSVRLRPVGLLGGLLSRRISPWTVALLAQLVGAITVSAAATTVAADLTAADLGWGAASGIGSGLGTVFLYRGLGGGQMNVVAPLSALGAAVVPVAVGSPS